MRQFTLSQLCWLLISVRRPVLVRAPCLSCSLHGSPGWSVAGCAHCEVEMEERKVGGEQGLQQPKVEKQERCYDWQLSGLLPAEVVPPVDCYYQQKEFPIALAATVSPLSPGGCYPIWEEMNRGPLTLYEVSVHRIFTEGAEWSKQA